MIDPLEYRQGIPFFCKKSESEFSRDIYEKFDEMVGRQTALHLADDLWQTYSSQGVLDFVANQLEIVPNARILEIGCSVGRLIATLAMEYPSSHCWGLDYSYQLLKRASEFWIDAKSINVDLTGKGMKKLLVKGKALQNLQFGLSRAEELPFDDESRDIVISSFLLDRLQDPIAGLREMHRVLVKGGQMIMVTPLNFTTADHWKELYPMANIKHVLTEIGYQIETWEENLIVIEPLDIHGNVILWKCLAVACKKA